jgi:hypothetical protein
MNKVFAFLKRWKILVGIGVVLIAGSLGAMYGIYLLQRPPQQPINFPHYKHVGIGAPCAYCHPHAADGPVAGLPTSSKCWGCHQQVQAKSPELDKLAMYVNGNQSIPWVPVAIQPDFVHFNHQPHIAFGINCETCHGNVAKMTTAQPQPRQNMGWCLNCHKQMAPDQWIRLSDCSTCHY